LALAYLHPYLPDGHLHCAQVAVRVIRQHR
jgi:hypothetical protein